MNPTTKPLYLYTIFDDNQDEFTNVIAEHCEMKSTMLYFSTGGRLKLLINLAPGFTMIQEDHE